MKTDLVEIFQTIRANIQPYATRGYAVHKNTDTAYDLYSEKNIVIANEKITERFFAGIYIEGKEVLIKINTTDIMLSSQNLIDFEDNKAGLRVNGLDDKKLKEVKTLVEIIHVHFKEKEWI